MEEIQISPAVLQASLRGMPPTRTERIEIVQTLYGIPSYSGAEGIKSEFEMRISALEIEVGRLKKESVGYMRLNSLPNKILKSPLDIVVEVDGNGYIARTVDLPLYGNGDDPIEAIDMLKREIESLCDDLMDDDNLAEDWLKVKRFLASRISD